MSASKSTSNVHQLGVKPRTTHHTYKRHDITVTYIPGTKEFKWSFTHTAKVVLKGKAPTADAALLKARAEVDKVVANA